MRKNRALRRNRAHLLADLERVLRPGRRATIVGYAWWWRYEIGIALGTAIGMYVLTSAVGVGQAFLGVAVTALVFGTWPASRQAFIASAWRIITPHRLRAGFVQARIHARDGRLPSILRTSQQPFGERVLVWCPAGTSAADFRSARGILTAACWATAITITTDESHAHLVSLDVIRHRRDSALPNALEAADSTDPGSGTGRLDEPGPQQPDAQSG